ncbi:MAG: metallophosphoesterase [Planctomycetes bacterium]|nr:metallophosphoesterase [Planctomycetota bacterium]
MARHRLEWIALSAGAIVWAALAFCGGVVLWVGEPRPACLTNREISGAPANYRFAVLGDTQKGITGLRRMLERLEAERPAFYAHTGDLVSDNDPNHYRLVRWALAEAGLDTPLFVAPGNHDVKGGTALFEKEIGPRERSFDHGAIRFITLDDAAGAPPPREALERRLKEAGGRPIVLFMHVPPLDDTSADFRPRAGFEGFVELVRAHPIRYVFSGHAHGYRRVQDRGTVYVVNGVGGDYDAWQLDQKVCATVVEVDGEKVRDRLIEMPPSHGVWDNVVHGALGHIAEAYRRRPIAAWGGTLVGSIAWSWLLVRCVRRRRSPSS